MCSLGEVMSDDEVKGLLCVPRDENFSVRLILPATRSARTSLLTSTQDTNFIITTSEDPTRMIADTEDKEEKSVAREGGRGDSTGIERQNLSDNDGEYDC